MTANSGAIIADLFPPERRGKAYGYNAVGWSIGAVLGIVVGGVMVTYLSWRWIFWINVPIGAFGVALAFRVLHDTGPAGPAPPRPGGDGCSRPWPFRHPVGHHRLATSSFDTVTTSFLVGGIALVAAFAVIEHRRAEPMLNLFAPPSASVTPTLLASLFQGLANFCVLFLVIMYLQGPRGRPDPCLFAARTGVRGGQSSGRWRAGWRTWRPRLPLRPGFPCKWWRSWSTHGSRSAPAFGSW